MTTERTLPDFDEPPVVETVLGVEFEPLPGFAVPHFGVYWKEIEKEYPRFEVQPSLRSQVERFGQAPTRLPGLRIELSSTPPVRCWFHDAGGTRLIQVQADRFLHNWRKHVVPEPYPHYENIQPMFEREWVRFREVMAAQGLGAAKVTQCEVTYVNHIERGSGWTSLANLGDVVTFWNGKAGSFLPAPEAATARCAFVMSGQDGRLQVDLQHAIRNTDLREILQLSLTARGRPGGSTTADIKAWMDGARGWVVKAFVDLTTPQMHRLWRRKV